MINKLQHENEILTSVVRVTKRNGEDYASLKRNFKSDYSMIIFKELVFSNTKVRLEVRVGDIVMIDYVDRNIADNYTKNVEAIIKSKILMNSKAIEYLKAKRGE